MQEQEGATTVGESIVITGSLRGDEDLTVLGRVEGNISLTKTLIVAQSGIIKAEVSVRDAIISGVVIGNITAEGCLEITSSGRILGDVKAERLVLNVGARVRGKVNVGFSAEEAAQEAAVMHEENRLFTSSRRSLPSQHITGQLRTGLQSNLAMPAANTPQVSIVSTKKKKRVSSQVEGLARFASC